jgi:hypothetical protein
MNSGYLQNSYRTSTENFSLSLVCESLIARSAGRSVETHDRTGGCPGKRTGGAERQHPLRRCSLSTLSGCSTRKRCSPLRHPIFHLWSIGLLTGALELRESFHFNPVNQVLSINAFTVPAGAPIPTPFSANLTAATFSIASMSVDKSYSSLSPRPNLMLTGSVATNSPVSPYGNLAGVPAALAIGYTADTPAKITNVVLLLAGNAVVLRCRPRAH